MKTFIFLLCVLTFFLLPAANTVFASDPHFAQWIKPITRPMLLQIIHSTSTSPEQYSIAISRATYSHLEEVALAEFELEAKHRPQDPIVQSAFGLMYFVETSDARGRQYKPSDLDLWRKQVPADGSLNMRLFRAATAAVEQSIRGPGENQWFCWFALGECHLIGMQPSDGQRESPNQQAQFELTEAARLNPTSFVVHTWLSMAFLPPGGNSHKALHEAQEAIALDPTDVAAYDFESRAYEALQNYKAAYYAEKQAIVLTPPGHPIPVYVSQNLNDLKQRAGL